MFGFLLAPLVETLRPHFSLSKTRIETLAVLLLGLANGRTVNLSHLASQFPGSALHASNYRRLQRFFQFERLDCRPVGAIDRENAEARRTKAAGARPDQLEAWPGGCEHSGFGSGDATVPGAAAVDTAGSWGNI